MFLPGYDEIARQLDGLGVPYLNAFSYFYHREFWGIEAVYQRCLTDERSRDTFLTVLTSRALHNSKLLYPVVTEMIYFAPPQFRILSRASRTLFVDCGAYTGDTLEEFVRYHMNYFHKYVAFEPSPTTYAALGKRARRLMEENLIRPEQIALEHKGCGRSQAVGKLVDNPYERAGNRLTAEGPGPEVEIVSLDHYFSDPAVPVTCIKADIEGAELDMLRGAEGVIRRDRPNLAICLYHCPGDLYEIPLLLKEFVPEYRMAVGQHGFCFEDTVLYCWVER